MLGPLGGDEGRDFRNPIGRPAKAGLSGNRISIYETKGAGNSLKTCLPLFLFSAFRPSV
jgi:hypothetical protein